jgi:serine/threonine protein kinase
MRGIHEVHPYKFLDEIGSGANGTVFKAVNVINANICALKCISFADAEKDKDKRISLIKNENLFLSTLHHPNIIKLYECIEAEQSIVLSLEYMEGGSIAQLLEKCGSFSETFAKIILKQTLMGLKCIHEKGIVHRDIKVYLIREQIYLYQKLELLKLQILNWHVFNRNSMKWIKKSKRAPRIGWLLKLLHLI